MLNQKMPRNIIMYQKIHYGLGVPKAKSNISPLKVVIEDTVSIIPQNNQNKSKLSIQGSLQTNKKKTFEDKQNISNQNTLNINQSQISEAESTSIEKDSDKYWKEFSKETSQKLWLPIKTDLQDLDMTYLNGFLNNTKQSSFAITKIPKNPQTNSQMTLCQSSLCSLPDTTEKENIKNELQYCRKIRFYPTTKFKILAEKCFGATRYLINKAIEGINKKTIDNPTNHISLRKSVLKTDKELELPENKKEKWLIDVPCDTKQLALKQLASNYKTGFTQLKNKTISYFNMEFKSKRSPYQSFFVDSRALKSKDMVIFSRRCKDKFKLRKKQEDWWNKNMKENKQNVIVKREKNKYYLCIPKKIKTFQSDNMLFKHEYNSVSLDPGVRTFQTFYSDEGVAGKIGDNACEGVIDVGLKIDKLISFLSLNKKSISKKTRFNIRKRCFLLRTKIKNKINDLHWKTANYLCSTFKHIFLPKFEVSKMVRKDIPFRARNIGSKTVRNMLSLSHGLFRDRILYMSNIWGSKIHLCDEHWTSKSCGGCGLIKTNLGGNKVYDCSDCNFKLDRDYNGARNIHMKQIKC